MVGWIPDSGSSPGGGTGNSLQYSCLENPMDRGAWRATVRRVAESLTSLSTHTDTIKKQTNKHTAYARTQNTLVYFYGCSEVK